MFTKFQRIMLALSHKADASALARTARLLTAVGGRALKGGAAVPALAGIGRAADQHGKETGSWVTIDGFRDGAAGPFDACDLRHWLRIAELAGVDAVPAVEILRLTEDQVSSVSGTADMGEGPASRRSKEALVAAAREVLAAAESGTIGGEMEDTARALELFIPSKADPEAVSEALFAAMDRVPEGWMVRNARTGPSGLKALAGSGHAGKTSPEVGFGPDVEIGPGWVRIGNRRRVVTDDLRTLTAIAQGPNGGTAFLARPWQKAARYFVYDDPHRRETPLRGPGVWPAEWRAFVENGEVVGVSSYYSWIGEATPENARIAVAVRGKAQAIADKASELGMWPRYMDIEFLRLATSPAITEDPRVQEGLKRFGRNAVACTLDFIETEEGLKLLEGGPANTPFGGGHPCGFAGCGGEPFLGNTTQTSGVAFRNMPHVLPGDPRTWKDGDRSGCILTWEEVAALAAAPSAGPAAPVG